MSRFDDLPYAQQAGILCNDDRFRHFVGARTIKSGVSVAASGCAEYVRQICQIQSRRDLNTSSDAQTRFHALRTEFDAWNGNRIRDRLHRTRSSQLRRNPRKQPV